MGRRARRRTPPAPRAAAAARPTPGRERALDRLPPARRVLAAYVGGAMVVALAVVLGIAVLGGTLGPFLVAAYALLGAGLLHRWASARLRGMALTDEDRMMQTMAGGLLVLSVGLAVVSVLVLTLT